MKALKGCFGCFCFLVSFPQLGRRVNQKFHARADTLLRHIEWRTCSRKRECRPRREAILQAFRRATRKFGTSASIPGELPPHSRL